ETVGILLGAGASVAAATQTGWTALMSAAGSGHAAVVDRLITAGADVNAWTRDSGTTPLLCAVGNGHAAVVRLLLARGANAALADSAGVTAAALARQLEHAEIARLLAAETTAAAGRRPLPQPDPVDPGRGFAH
ncbi:MAG TPA: ankyrin repeat domain-containing protein, partial [Acidobacteriota bacterium]|nr:ankyrin repeat domain-containing protein [Acidobacteriota bacterium]